MREFLQIVIPAALTALVAGRVAVTRTGRLRRTIQANVELLGTLPADHPSREDLASHIEDLVDTLVLREQGQFAPMTWIAAWIGLWAITAAIGLFGATLMVMDTLPRITRLGALSGFAAMVLASVSFAVAGVVRWRQERDLDDEEPDPDDDQTRLLTAS
jgi:hypothetical protein